MNSTEVLCLLVLLAVFCFFIVKDKKLDGMLPFYVLTGLFIVGSVLHLLYLAAKRWL